MKKIILFTFFISSIFASGEDVFNKKCLECHVKYVPIDKLVSNFEGGNKELKLKAPTLNQLSFRLKSMIGDPRGDEDMHRMEVGSFISDYVIHPDKNKSVCMDVVMEHFETMPSLEGKIDDEELEEVNEYIYNFDKETNPNKIPWGKVESIKNDNNIYLVEVMSDSCYFCKTMDKDVFSQNDVISLINRNFIPIRINKSLGDNEGIFATQFIPTFYFVKNGQIIKKLPGAWKYDDFKELLIENKGR